MKIIHELPPIWDEVIAAGMKPNPANVVFTFADAIYVPSGKPIPDHLVAHEETHAEQQGFSDEGARVWWSRYILDPWFRMVQEAEAYARQYDFICRSIKDRNQRHVVLTDFSRMMSSPTYGSVIKSSDAYEMLKERIKTKR